MLLYSYADRKTHEFFFERDYPPADILDRVYRRLGSQPLHKEEVRGTLKMDSELFEKALEKLAIHGGGVLDFEENAVQGHQKWRTPMRSRRSGGNRNSTSSRNRCGDKPMPNGLLDPPFRRHGGRADESAECNMCAPEDCVAKRFRPPTETETKTARGVILGLKKSSAGSTGKLHKEMFPREEVSRDEFENLLRALARAGLLRIEELTFEKDGRSIAYRRSERKSDR